MRRVFLNFTAALLGALGVVALAYAAPFSTPQVSGGSFTGGTLTSALNLSSQAVTATGSGQGDAAAITADRVTITGGAGGTGVLLTAVAAGRTIIITNTTASAKTIYPNGSETIQSASSLTIQANEVAMFTYRAASTWTAEMLWYYSAGIRTSPGSISVGGSVTVSSSLVANGGVALGDGATDTIALPPSATVTAFAGGGTASATQMSGTAAVLTTVGSAADSVKMPALTASGRFFILSNRGANAAAVFPGTGDQLCISGSACGAVDASQSIAANATWICLARDATTWDCK
jgi:hypothetical protein